MANIQQTERAFAPRPEAEYPRGSQALDASQSAVLDLSIDVSAAVIGAPGSGKTLTLVELVADRVLNLGFSTDEVLVLAPNRDLTLFPKYIQRRGIQLGATGRYLGVIAGVGLMVLSFVLV